MARNLDIDNYRDCSAVQDFLAEWAKRNLSEGDRAWEAWEAMVENLQETLPPKAQVWSPHEAALVSAANGYVAQAAAALGRGAVLYERTHKYTDLPLEAEELLWPLVRLLYNEFGIHTYESTQELAEKLRAETPNPWGEN